MQKPGRPLGVTLAIVASVMLFTVFPLMIVAMVLLVQSHFQNLNFDGSDLEPIAMGGDFMGVPPASLGIQVILSLVFLVIAIFAWRGRPPFIRYVILVAVLVLTGITFAVTIAENTSPQNLPQGMSSLDSMLRSGSCGLLVLDLLVSLYVAWYLNRGPARAFYRGYYLPDPAGALPTPAAGEAERVT